MHENEYRSLIVAVLAPVLAFPIENSVDVGTPDVGCLMGWIEIKLAVVPALPTSVVSVDVRPAQRIFMRRWTRHGGHGWYLTRLHHRGQRTAVWMMHEGLWGADNLGKVSMLSLEANAVMRYACHDGVPSYEALVNTMNESVRRLREKKS